MPKRAVLAVAAACALATGARAQEPPPQPPVPSASPWAFAVSGDSRDCGDLVMPKIAAAVTAEASPAVDFYWHLGDFRRMYDVDCDILVRRHPDFDCKRRPLDAFDDDEMSSYEEIAWSDFVDQQLEPFGALPIFLGIGNHELYGRNRDDFARTFRPWLEQKALHAQRLADRTHDIRSPGTSTYHFVRRGVDFIYLDNGDEQSFTADQLVWLARVLAQDAADATVRTIVVGMHQALPYSAARIHAMDASCQGICAGQQAYDLLYRAQNFAGPPAERKHVYLLASHAHAFLEGIYDTSEHQGQVLPGWIIGTAGAVQSSDAIRYGYLLVTVEADGTITPVFREVTRTSPPLASGPGATNLTDFCFTDNKRKQADDSFRGQCACGAIREVPAESH
ncbi:MAG TPA: hypothetical protein VGV61_18425 [Thermoanaerobaculia bacterium]|jgi:hypothetical protein|nr:hypothetical protein [Thermoanaerobaculia bacterium]